MNEVEFGGVTFISGYILVLQDGPILRKCDANTWFQMIYLISKIISLSLQNTLKMVLYAHLGSGSGFQNVFTRKAHQTRRREGCVSC